MTPYKNQGQTKWRLSFIHVLNNRFKPTERKNPVPKIADYNAYIIVHEF